MDIPLLTTKLYAPPPRSDLIHRPRLVAQLDAGLPQQRKLTLVSAPAGFGKTTLLGAWIAESERPAAWLSLESADNDPLRFWRYVVAALQTLPSFSEAEVGATIPATLASPQPPPIEVLLTDLLNEIAATPEPFLLVLDDYHVIHESAIHDGLAFLLEHLPPTLHLVIATRADPPLPLARLRGRRQLTELRARDLRFTPEETTAFFRRMAGLNLSDDEIGALEHRTEGWITGLQLAALSLRDQEDAAAFIADFTGSHRYVLDYLTEEVLRRQSPEIRAFLLQTSILNRMTAPLCEALLESEIISNAQATLERLEAQNLFVVPLDEQRRWYRYHRLFADLLRVRLEDEQPERVPHLHARASAWYEREGLLEPAFRHALDGKDTPQALRIAETHGRPMLLRGELTTLQRWIGALPHKQIHHSAELSVLSAWVYLLTGQIPSVERYTQQAESLLAEGHHLHGDIATIRAYAAAERGEIARAVTLAEHALQLMGDKKRGEQGVAYFVLSGTRMMQGNLHGAAEAARRAADVGQQGGNLHIVLPALNTLASVQMTLGELHEAQATAEAALERATPASGKPLPIAAGPLSTLADLALEWNDLERAEGIARQAVALSERWGNQDNLCAAYLTLAQILIMRKAANKAQEAHQKAQTVSCSVTVLPTFPPCLRATQAQLWLATGDLIALTAWIRETRLPTPLGPVHADEALTLTRAHLALDDLDAATQVLANVREMARAHGMTTARIEALALQAVVHHRQGESSQAQATLLEALTLADPQGYVRRFIGLGTEMTALLRKINTSQQPPHITRYIESLLQAAGEPPETPPRKPQPALIEPLSERELEVLTTVAEGLTNRETAQRLYIAESTVKSHLNSVYGKLDVTNRTEAVAKARHLGLI